MHIQQLAVIIAFNEELLNKAISLLAVIPVVGVRCQEPLRSFLVEQKRKLHDKSSMVRTKTFFLIYFYKSSSPYFKTFDIFLSSLRLDKSSKANNFAEL